jgi:colanic acid biosynthesis glycosyl transferase WcaI
VARRKALVEPMVDEAPPVAYRLPAQTKSGGSRLAGARVLIVSMYYRPETTGSAPYTADLAEHLAAMGAHVRVVAAQPHYPAWRRPEGVPNALTVSHEDGVEVVRVPGYVPRRPTLLRRALYELAYVSAARHHVRADDADLVLACTPSLFAGWLGARVAAKAGVPCVTVAQDLITSAAQQSGMGGAGRVGRLLSAVEARTFRRSAHVTVPSAAFVPVVRRLAPDSPVTVVPNWSRITDAVPEDAGAEGDASRRRAAREALRVRLGWQGRFVIAHTGNMGLKQGLEDLAPALHHLARATPEALVSFVGEGSRRLALEAATAGLGSVEIRDPVPADEYPMLLDAADALLVHERSTVRDMSLPSKLTSYFTAGRPVVAVVRDDSATAAELARSGAGLLVEPLDPAAFTDRVAALRGDLDLRAQLGAAGTAFARRHLHPTAALDGLSRLMEAVLRDSTDLRKARV